MERSGRASSSVGAEGALPCTPPVKRRWDNVPLSPKPVLLKMLTLFFVRHMHFECDLGVIVPTCLQYSANWMQLIALLSFLIVNPSVV